MNIAIFASGSGSNALKIMEYFKRHKKIQVSLICTDNPHAGIIEKSAKYEKPVKIFSKEEYCDGNFLAEYLKSQNIDFVVLAGYLKLIPKELIAAYPQKIVNIHPALLPKYGGKGMYGMNIHKAVIANKEEVSGITIHLVDEIYDNGRVLFQEALLIFQNWTAETLQQEILRMEHYYFAAVIDDYILENCL
jgi:phosphoribosylglycinamide formyltransferase-1